MALFSRQLPLADAVKAVLGALERGASPQVTPELVELSRLLSPGPPMSEPERGDAQQFLQEVLDALPEPAGVLETTGTLLRSNTLLDRLFGQFLDGRSLGRTLLELTRSSELQEAGAQALSGRSVKREVTLPALQKVVLASLSPLSQARAFVVLSDLTEQKRLEQSRRDFVANASHELRTPVAAISGAVETLLSSSVELPAPARGFVQIIERHSTRLSRLTQDLLDLSRLEAGEWRFELAPMELAGLFDNVLELVRTRAFQRKVQLCVELPPKLRVLADRRAVEQILVNLLDNAVKYSPEGGRVTLLADGAGAQIRMSVIDQGPGIEQRNLARIFERFYRVDGGRAREAGGTGLGLAIVKHLATALGGEVGVESGQGGSRFWVKFKAAAEAS